MCGIAGLFVPDSRFSQEELTTIVEGMLAPLIHRGPDGAGLWTNSQLSAGMGHRRLSVVDLSDAGRQPMTSSTRRWTINYNGELYNKGELQSRLRFEKFRGHSDTEVFIESVAEFGVVDTLRFSDAMFAVAFWDSESQELWLARDRFGEKPLYYCWVNGVLYYASELKAFRAVSEINQSLDPVSVLEYFNWGTVSGSRTIYSSIHKVEPGTAIRFDGSGRSHPSVYWSALQAAREGSQTRQTFEDVIPELEYHLRRSVRSRMISDVPLGAFLSGGIDSSLVVALMQGETGAHTRTFSVGFTDKRYDESSFATAIAAQLGTTHTQVEFTDSDVSDLVPLVLDSLDQPFADSSVIPTFLVSRIAKREVTVSLSGDGGDELFGGYRRYGVFAQIEQWRGRPLVPWIMRHALKPLRRVSVGVASVGSHNGSTLFGRLAREITPSRITKLAESLGSSDSSSAYRTLVYGGFSARHCMHDDIWISEPRTTSRTTDFTDPYEYAMLEDIQDYLPNDVLLKVDTASMANSLEVRAPLLNPDLFKFAWSIPRQLRQHGDQTKWPLRQVLKQFVPPHLFERPKQGFGVPMDNWLRGPLRPLLFDTLSSENIRHSEYIDAAKVGRLLTEHDSLSNDHSAALWSLLAFCTWEKSIRK